MCLLCVLMFPVKNEPDELMWFAHHTFMNVTGLLIYACYLAKEQFHPNTYSIIIIFEDHIFNKT